MSMAPAKRQAGKAAAASSSGAKRAKTDLLAGKCAAIAESVKAAPGFPKEMLQMVAGTVKVSLQEVKEDRHPFAEKCLKMVDEALQALQTSMSERVCSLEAKVAESDTEKAARVAAAEAAVAALAEKTEALAATKATLTEACQETAAAKAANAEAEEEKKAGAMVYTQAVENKAKLESVLSGDYDMLKQTTAGKLVKAFVKFARDFDFEGNLIEAAEATLSLPPMARGTFDALVIKELDSVFSAKIAALEETIRNEEPAKAEREAKVEATAARLQKASEEEAARKSELAGAQAAVKEAEGVKKAAERAVKDFGPELKRAGLELVGARKELSECEGVLGSFKELAERAAPVPEKEPEDAPAASEEKAPAVEGDFAATAAAA